MKCLGCGNKRYRIICPKCKAELNKLREKYPNNFLSYWWAGVKP